MIQISEKSVGHHITLVCYQHSESKRKAQNGQPELSAHILVENTKHNYGDCNENSNSYVEIPLSESTHFH